jgi:glucose-6-phosphate isomerase
MTNDDRPQVVAEPAHLEPDAILGRLAGGNGRYEKFLADLDGIYRDANAFQALLDSDSGEPVYWVETSTLDEGDGALTIGVSTLLPGRVGDEFFVTRGHIHAKHSAAELYYGLRGRGVMLMETVAGETRAIEITPGVNVGDEPFVTLFCYPSDAGQDYGIIGAAGGMKDLVVTDGEGWTLRPNTDHRDYGQGGPATKDGDL